MSSDRELLELAAKAAGIKIDTDTFGEYQDAHRGMVVADGEHWNPLCDDGDALRLAVKMGLDILRTERDVEALAGLPPNAKIDAHSVAAPCAVELLGDDPCAATRRAIVRASAAIAKATGGAA